MTSPQSATTYTVTVSNVTRASDGLALTNNTAMFIGRPPFDVASALATTTHLVDVTFCGLVLVRQHVTNPGLPQVERE